MTRVDVFQPAIRVKRAEKHGGITLHLRVVAEEPVDVRKSLLGVRAECCGGKSALQHRGHQSCPKPLSRNVRENKCDSARAQIEKIEIVSANFEAGLIAARNFGVGIVMKLTRKQSLL